MADRKVVPFLMPTFQQRNLKIVGQQKIKNFYFQTTPGMMDGRGQLSLISTPGLSSAVASTVLNSVRACISYNNVGYAVIGATFKKIASDFTVTDLGVTLTFSTGPVSMAATGTEVVICTEDKLYRINTTNDVVTDITSSLTSIDALNIPIKVMAQNSRFIYMTSNSNYIYLSNLLDADTITALDAFQPNTIAGTLSAGAVTTWHQYYFNDSSVEIFRDTGAEIGPFSRVEGGVIPVGIAANQSALNILNKVYFLGRTKDNLLGIVEIDATNYSIVSTPDFVQRVDDYLNYSDAFAWSDTHNGHSFYNITFPNVELSAGFGTNLGKTWSYDVMTKLWFERTSYIASESRETRHVANCSMFLNGKQLIGTFNTGDFHEISTDYLDDNGAAIYREIITGTLIDRDSYFSVYNLEIDIERGIGLVTGQGSDPQLTLEISKDRGNTYSQARTVSCGANGQYSKRVRFASLGGGRSLVLRIRMTDPVPWAVAGITAEIEGSVD